MKAWKTAVLTSMIVAGILVPTYMLVLYSRQQTPVQQINGDMTTYAEWKETVSSYPTYNIPINSSGGTWISAFYLCPNTDLPFVPESSARVVVFNVFNSYYNTTYYVYGFKSPIYQGWYLGSFAFKSGQIPPTDQVVIDCLLSFSETYGVY